MHQAEAESTTIRFELAGNYKLVLLARNRKEEQRIEKTLTIKTNSGIGAIYLQSEDSATHLKCPRKSKS